VRRSSFLRRGKDEKSVQTCHNGRRKGRRVWALSWVLKISAKEVVFLVSSGKKLDFTTFDPPLENFWKNTLVAPPWNKSF